MSLRQLNFVGLDNVKGYSEEVKQKLTPAAHHESLTFKQSQNMLAIKEEEE